MNTISSQRRGRAATVAIWVVTSLLVLEFVLAGGGKFSFAARQWQREFSSWGLPLWSVPVVGVIEVGSALLLLVPRFAAVGGMSLAATMLGATGTHIVHGEWPRVVLTLILCALSLVVVRARLAALRFPGRRLVTVGAVLLLVVRPTHPLRAQAAWFIATRGADTMSIEHFERAGSTITGDWVTLVNGPQLDRDVQIHHYVISLGSDGRPRTMTVAIRKPDGVVTLSYNAQFGTDSAIITMSPDTAPPKRIGASRSFPVLSSSMAPLELAFSALRAEGHSRDSTAFVAVQVAGRLVSQTVPIFFLGPDSALFGPAPAHVIAHFDRAGHLVDVTSPSAVIKRVAPFDLEALTARAAAAAKP